MLRFCFSDLLSVFISLVNLLKLFPWLYQKRFKALNPQRQTLPVTSSGQLQPLSNDSHILLIPVSTLKQYSAIAAVSSFWESLSTHESVIMLLWIREGTPSIWRLLIMNESTPKIRISHLALGVSLGVFDLKQRCAEWSPYDIKYRESDKRADGSYAFESLSRYFDVTLLSFCAEVERAYCDVWSLKRHRSRDHGDLLRASTLSNQSASIESNRLQSLSVKCPISSFYCFSEYDVPRTAIEVGILSMQFPAKCVPTSLKYMLHSFIHTFVVFNYIMSFRRHPKQMFILKYLN